jgi:hypothetical protein
MIVRMPLHEDASSVFPGQPANVRPAGNNVSGELAADRPGLGNNIHGVFMSAADKGEDVDVELFGTVLDLYVVGLNGETEIAVGHDLRATTNGFEPNSDGYSVAIALEPVAGDATFPRMVKSLVWSGAREIVQGVG